MHWTEVREQPHNELYDHLIAGWFHETPQYRTVRPRGTRDWLLIYTASGCGRFGAPGPPAVDAEAPFGSITLVRPGTFHDYGTAPTSAGWELLWTHFRARPHWTPWLAWPEIAPGLMRLELADSPQRKSVETLLRSVYRTVAASGHPHHEQLAMTILEQLLLECDLANPLSGHRTLDPRIAGAIDLIFKRLGDPALDIPTLASHACLSESRLAHLFREEMGVSIQQFIERQRIDRARQLLEVTGRAVQSIGSDVGFDSAFYFSSRFRKLTGESPTEYRARRRGNL
jgi:AraC family transcriptional regulator of arabinose operon